MFEKGNPNPQPYSTSESLKSAIINIKTLVKLYFNNGEIPSI